ncbi:VanZ family protein [Paenibacillus turicensis]|uniref:VanZ family protein n=1 Tax=Paenibacillus turicensis TaxID=160487 RepID=UPI003D2789AE
MNTKNLFKKLGALIFYIIALAILVFTGYIVIVADYNTEVMKYLLLLGLGYIVSIFVGKQFHKLLATETKEQIGVVRLGLLSYFTYYIVLLYFFLFKGGPTWEYNSWSDYMKDNTNLVPFKTIINYINDLISHNINVGTVLQNLLGNFVLFMPMALFAILLLPKGISKLKKYAGFILLIVAVELIQGITRTGFCDIDDLILNSVGFIVADVSLTYILNKLRTHSDRFKSFSH